MLHLLHIYFYKYIYLFRCIFPLLYVLFTTWWLMIKLIFQLFLGFINAAVSMLFIKLIGNRRCTNSIHFCFFKNYFQKFLWRVLLESWWCSSLLKYFGSSYLLTIIQCYVPVILKIHNWHTTSFSPLKLALHNMASLLR